jgi:hypothetical protein
VPPDAIAVLRRDPGLVDGDAHRPQPGVAMRSRDPKRHVAGGQATRPAQLRVGRRASPVLGEVEPQALLGGPEVGLGVQRPQDLVDRDERVEARDDPAKRRLAADGVVEALRLRRSRLTGHAHDQAFAHSCLCTRLAAW